MSGFPDPQPTIGAATGQQTVAALVKLRLEREIELAKIFNALGLVRGQDKAEDAVAIIGELIALASGAMR